MSEGHSCYAKAREIEKRLHIFLGLDSHDIISEMCKEWGVANADEFFMQMRAMSDDELRAAIEDEKRRLRKKKIGLKISDEIYQEVTAYA